MHKKKLPSSINGIFFEKQPPGPSPKMGCIENRWGLPTEWVIPKSPVVKDYQRDSAKRHEKCKVDGQIHLPSLIFSCILFFWWWSSKYFNGHKTPPLLSTSSSPSNPSSCSWNAKKREVQFLTFANNSISIKSRFTSTDKRSFCIEANSVFMARTGVTFVNI